MLPIQTNYPEFVADQLLTSEHLNLLFGYLEEQGRLTRTNLIGIGIVCGLEVKTNAAGTEITITKGCGVTSEGYLVSVPETTYTFSKPFNAVQERIYDRFVDGSKNPRFAIEELKQAAVEEGTTPLSLARLTNKVVLIFVEILEEGAKNCNPNSCDDKGINVTVTFRPLLIDKTNADAMGQGNVLPKELQALPDLKMRRYDVIASSLKNTAAVFEAYQRVLNAAFLDRTEQVLSKCYTTFKPLITDRYPDNPFVGLAADFNFLHNGTINEEQLLNLQYYYDLFSDFLLAYEELRTTGTRLLSICCPDHNLFPRHLFLDLAIPNTAKPSSDYRHYFIPSPILQCNSALVKELRSLFKRLVLLLEKFFTPPSVIGGNNSLKRGKMDNNIRITPSKYGDIPLSDKSIPFYYKVTEGTERLLEHWSFRKSLAGRSDKNLSYYATDYNATDEEVTEPLLYDLEPYNFLRIEGHIGKSFTHVLRNILSLKKQHRLPFEVIALSTDVAALRSGIRDMARRTTATGLAERFATGQEQPQCQFQDLESLYDTLAAGLTCSLCKEMKYFYDLPNKSKRTDPLSFVPQVPLLKKCDPGFRFKANTMGHEFELFYEQVKDEPYISAAAFLGSSGGTNPGGAKTGLMDEMLLYYIQKLSETITEDLSDFDIDLFNSRYNDLLKIASKIREILRALKFGNEEGTLTEDVLDHLDALIFVCNQAQFNTLYKDYLSRWVYVMMLQKFGYFLKMHPGIQHKAGVTIGGTFILVYHEADEEGTESGTGHLVHETGPKIEKVAARKTKKAMETLTEKVETLNSEATRVENEASIIRSLSRNKLNENSPLNYLEDMLRGDKDMDQGLARLIEEISNGTVIADFYLPYLCYSDCPPVHFFIGDEKEPAEKLTIEIDRKDFCQVDKKAFPVTVSPEGGQVTGEGIKIGTDNKATFIASDVDLQGNKQKTVILTYTKDGQMVNTQVLVHQMPTAAFTVVRTPVFNEVFFKNDSPFGDTFEWDFGDHETSTEESPKHTYQNEGSYTVSLTVTNGSCTSKPHTDSFEVKKEEERVCQPLAEIREEFNGLSQVDDKFPDFVKELTTFKEMQAFFKSLGGIIGKPVGDQIDFFIHQDIAKKLQRWLSEIFKFVGNERFSRLAFAFYNVLVKLAMYIQCIQTEDLSKGKIDMAQVFETIQGHAKIFGDMARQNPTRFKHLVFDLCKPFKEELVRIDKTTRPKYFAAIDNIINLLTA